MNIVALAPYNEKMGKAFEACCNSKIGNITLVGNKERIENAMVNYNLNYELICASNEEEMVEYVKRIMAKDLIIIFGEISEYYQRKLFDVKQENNLGLIKVLDIKGFKNYIFTSIEQKKRYPHFDDKKESIIRTYEFMNSLGIKKSNVALISSDVSKADLLETNIIKVVEKKYKNLKIVNPVKIKEVLEKKDKFTNMLVFKNYDVCKMFIDTVTFFKAAVVGSINYYDTLKPLRYFISYNEEMDEKNFLFSILVIAKSIEKSKENFSTIA